MRKLLILFLLSFIFNACKKEENVPNNINSSTPCSIEGRWNLTGFETNTMYVFDSTLRYTIYSNDGIFGTIDDAIPNPNSYTLADSILSIDLSFGNYGIYSAEFKCDCNVVDLTQDDVVWKWWREGYDEIECNE